MRMLKGTSDLNIVCVCWSTTLVQERNCTHNCSCFTVAFSKTFSVTCAPQILMNVLLPHTLLPKSAVSQVSSCYILHRLISAPIRQRYTTFSALSTLLNSLRWLVWISSYCEVVTWFVNPRKHVGIHYPTWGILGSVRHCLGFTPIFSVIIFIRIRATFAGFSFSFPRYCFLLWQMMSICKYCIRIFALCSVLNVAVGLVVRKRNWHAYRR